MGTSKCGRYMNTKGSGRSVSEFALVHSDGKIISGIYNGVKVCVIKTNGKIATVFPDSNQNSALRKKKKGRKR